MSDSGQNLAFLEGWRLCQVGSSPGHTRYPHWNLCTWDLCAQWRCNSGAVRGCEALGATPWHAGWLVAGGVCHVAFALGTLCHLGGSRHCGFCRTVPSTHQCCCGTLHTQTQLLCLDTSMARRYTAATQHHRPRAEAGLLGLSAFCSNARNVLWSAKYLVYSWGLCCSLLRRVLRIPRQCGAVPCQCISQVLRFSFHMVLV